MSLSSDIVAAVKVCAPRVGIETAGMLAVIEVETSGRPFEPADLDPSDGLEPIMLFERHVFHRELKKLAPGLLKGAVKAGLALARRSPKTQYADQKTSAAKLALIERAVAIHPEAAYRSVSMGLFQVMGFNFALCGYASAVEMHDALTKGGMAAHLAAGVAFMRSASLLKHLAAHKWDAFAKGYNGPAYKENQYDTKLADSYARWTATLRAPAVAPAVAADPTVLKLGDRGPRVRALQEALATFGLPLTADSAFGPATRRAVAAAQVELGLNGTGIADPAFVLKLEGAPPISRGAREVASKKEVKEVSQPARYGDNIALAGKVGLGAVGSYVATAQDTATQVQSGVDTARATKEAVTAVVGEGFMSSVGVWVVGHWQALAVAAACATAIYVGSRLVRCAVANYRAGRTV